MNTIGLSKILLKFWIKFVFLILEILGFSTLYFTTKHNYI